MNTTVFSSALAKLKSQVQFIPGASLRQMWILRFVKKWTGSHYASLFLADDLGRYNGGMLWPIGPDRLRLMAKLGPALTALLPASELFERIWDSPSGRAFQIPEPFYTDSPLYRYVFREFDHRHVAVYSYPVREDGNQPVVFACRPHQGGIVFEPAALAALERICGEFGETLESVRPAGPYLPRLARPEEHVLRLDADCRPETMPLYVEALLTVFYGPFRDDSDPTRLLPPALEDDIRSHREDYLKSAYATEGGFFHAFTKAHRGRVLCLTVQSERDGAMKLSVHEDLSRHKRLSRIKAACRELTRDRARVFSSCLLLEEGVASTEEIARRAGFAALKASSAHQIVKQARRVLAGISGG